MRKIILISLFAIVANCLIAQEQAKYYIKNLDAYVGTWEYVSDTCTFRIYLKKGKSYASKGGTFWNEMVFGGHYIARNGVVITNLERLTKTADDRDSRMTIVASNARETATEVDPNELTFTFNDVLKDSKRGHGKLTLIPGNPAKLHWQILKTDERVIILFDGAPMPVIHLDWTVPEDVILTKIYDTIGPPPTPLPPLPPQGPGGGGNDELLPPL
jgi:hypothetical protein